MRIFARVAAVQNLSSVGAELGLTPGTISKRLQALEEELSVRLFDRTTRSIRITEEGATFLGHVERILCELSMARAAVSANVNNPKGKLRISAPATLGRNVIAPAISRFASDFPAIDIHIDLTDRIVNLQEEGYDVVIRTGSLESSTLKAKRLADDPQILVAAPTYLEKHEPPVTPTDLSHHACLVLGETQVWTFHRNNEETPVRVAGRLRSDNGELLRYAALDGHGIVRLSRLRVLGDIERGLLRQVLPDYETASNSAVWALYPSTPHILPKLRVFLDFLGRWFRNEAESKVSVRVAAPRGRAPRMPRRAGV